MKEIFFPRLPEVGDEFDIIELDLNGENRPVARIQINKIEIQTVSVWNSALKKRQQQDICRVSFEYDGGMYQRTAVIPPLEATFLSD